MTERRPRRILIVGAKFGEIYANAFLDHMPGVSLAGIMANGSERSRKLAHAFGVPLYTRLEDVPQDIDIACVVVRSTIVGGEGSRLAESLLRKGLHVVQEHPIHPEEVARLQKLARELCRVYWVGSFYSNATAGKIWIDTARQIQGRVGPPQIATLTTSRQLLYSGLDLLLHAMAHPITLPEASASILNGLHADSLRLTCGQTDISLSLQNYIDPEDPDMHSLVMHQILLGWQEGYLSLTSSYGPVIWVGNWFDPAHLEASTTLYDGPPETRLRLRLPARQILHEGPETWQQIFEHDAPTCVRRLLEAICTTLDGEDASLHAHASHQYQVAAAWQSILHCTGPAHERNIAPPQTLHINTCATSSTWERI